MQRWLLALVLFASGPLRADDPTPLGEFLRLDHLIVPTGRNELWAFTPTSALIVESQKLQRAFVDGKGFQGAPTTFASTSKGWLLGTTDGVWEIRLNEGDLRYLPELLAEGVYRFEGDLAFTPRSIYRLSVPWERYDYRGFAFLDANDVYALTDTLCVATRKGLRRLLWSRRTWDDAPLGSTVERERLVRFLLPSTHNEVDLPDSVLIRTRPVLLGERHIFHEDPGSRQWLPVEGIDFPRFRRDNSDSVYRKVDGVLFRAPGGEAGRVWRRWLVAPTGICKIELPDGGTPYVTESHPLIGDVRATFVESLFVWVATTEDLYVIDREFDNVDRFLNEDGMFVWGFLGRPREFTYNVKGEERGWYALTSAGMTEVFTESWSWDAYGFDGFGVEDVLCVTDDLDGYWVGTRRGLRWFSAAQRQWVPGRPPPELREAPILKLEWYGADLYVFTPTGIHTNTRRSFNWRKVE
jgi:hypothetical protein